MYYKKLNGTETIWQLTIDTPQNVTINVNKPSDITLAIF